MSDRDGQQWGILVGMAPDLSPMLAERGLPNGSLDRWAVEPKLDGWRDGYGEGGPSP